jgi:hypothetical protein
VVNTGRLLRDTPAYEMAAGERHWETLLALLDAKLKKPLARSLLRS